MNTSRYIVGIDLGTTNTCVFYVDSESGGLSLTPFMIPQLTGRGTIEKRDLLPSFCYLEKEETIVGAFAKEEGSKVPTRLVQSAKSWLCNAAAARRDKILPIEASDRRISPVEATAHYLRHILFAWNKEMKEPLEEQEVILTVPASFDEVARLLTVESAKEAGFKNLTLLEEPQAAFYSWILAHEKKWKTLFKQGEQVLVVDVGGGTTDFSLIEVSKDGFQRMKVGNHLLLGGDNMDEAIAHLIETKLTQPVTEWRQLVFAARKAKEVLLSEDAPAVYSVFLQGSGSKVIGGSRQCELAKEELETFLAEGFFKQEPLEESLKLKKRSGLISMGLPYESDASITKHLAVFLHGKKPDYVLFNGGSMKPKLFREGILKAIGLWFNSTSPQELDTFSLDLAVARGACYYGKAKRGLGIKIGGGLPRAYYLQLDDNKALTLLPKGSEEGHSYESSKEFLAEVGVACKFQILTSSVRLEDVKEEIVEIKEEEMLFLPPIQTVLRYGKSKEKIPVRLIINFTSIGTIELWLQSTQSSHKWLLEFQLRDSLSSLEKARVDETFTAGSLEPIIDIMLKEFREDPKNLISKVETALELTRNKWPPSLLRALFDAILKIKEEKSSTNAREIRFWNLAGFLLRPGFGYPLDDYRIKELWKIILADLNVVKGHDTEVQRLIAFRRIAGGLNKGQQTQIASSILPLESKNPFEYAEKVRLFASLELLDIPQKIRVGNTLVKKIQAGKAEECDIWALGRMGARHLLVGSIANVIPTQTCIQWLEALLPLSFKHKSTLIEHLARKVSLRELQLPQELVSRLLKEVKHPNLLTEVVPIHREEQEELLGDHLPPGLTLLS